MPTHDHRATDTFARALQLLDQLVDLDDAALQAGDETVSVERLPLLIEQARLLLHRPRREREEGRYR